jgi:hypothetical protein
MPATETEREWIAAELLERAGVIGNSTIQISSK